MKQDFSPNDPFNTNKPSTSLIRSIARSLLKPVLAFGCFSAFATPAFTMDETQCLNMSHFQQSSIELEITDSQWFDSRSIAPRFPGMPTIELSTHCHVEGVIEKRIGVNDVEYGIRFALNLPKDWNGRFLFQGGGGLNGTVNEPLGNQASGSMSALSRGFAVVSNDTGHQSQTGFDASFMNDQIARLNFLYQANPKVAVVAKALIAEFYDQAPDYSYFVGCSTGGREGMIMSQRFPEHFDGIVSGAPAIRTNLSNVAMRWVATHLRSASPDSPEAPFSIDQQHFIVDGIVEACDALDGSEDGLIFNSQACAFDPHVLSCSVNDSEQCLTTEQADALITGFSGPVDSRGVQIYPGFPFDTGIDDGFGIPSLLQAGNSPVSTGAEDPLHQDIDAEFILATAPDETTGNSTSLALSSFSGQGGKIIFYHGAADPWFSANDTVRYYDMMSSANGGNDIVDEWSRLFLVPGMGHCQGGEATLDSFDMISAIVEWTENDNAPDSIIATGQSMPNISRPLCPWPQHPHYTGSGDESDAANFQCRD